jgi:helix-turn-helix protein
MPTLRRKPPAWRAPSFTRGTLSVWTTARVWKDSRHGGSALLVLLAIADYAHEDGSGAFPSLKTLAKKTRLSVRQVRRVINETLVPSGELTVIERTGTTNLMTVVVGEYTQPTPVAGDLPDDLQEVARDLPVRTLPVATSVAGDPPVRPSPTSKPSVNPREPFLKRQPSEDGGALRGPAMTSGAPMAKPRRYVTAGEWLRTKELEEAPVEVRRWFRATTAFTVATGMEASRVWSIAVLEVMDQAS